jgi:hypothetical protein
MGASSTMPVQRAPVGCTATLQIFLNQSNGFLRKIFSEFYSWLIGRQTAELLEFPAKLLEVQLSGVAASRTNQQNSQIQTHSI